MLNKGLEAMYCRQRGVAIIEMVIILPLLIILLAAVVDGVGYMQGYLTSNSLAREIARVASSTADLPQGSYNYEGYSNAANGVVQVILSRGDFIAESRKIARYSVKMDVQSAVVRVQVRVPYDTLFVNDLFGWRWVDPAVSARATFPRLIG